jgi:hypothetical protein
MTVRRLFLSLLIPALILITSACSNPFKDLFGGDDSTTAPSPNSTTDTFNGTLAPNGSLVFTFSVATAGNVAVTLTSVTPATTSPLGLGVGSYSSGNCTVANSTSGVIAAASPQLSAMQSAGASCVKVSDAGGLAAASTVTVTVAHP